MSLLEDIEKNFELIDPYKLLDNGWEWDDYGKSLRIQIYSTVETWWPGHIPFESYRDMIPTVMVAILTDINCTHEPIFRTIMSDNPVYYEPPKPKWRLELFDTIRDWRINIWEETVLTEMIELNLKLEKIVFDVKNKWNVPERYINNKLLR